MGSQSIGYFLKKKRSFIIENWRNTALRIWSPQGRLPDPLSKFLRFVFDALHCSIPSLSSLISSYLQQQDACTCTHTPSVSSLYSPCPCAYCFPLWACPFLPLHLWTCDTHFQAQLKSHVFDKAFPSPALLTHAHKHILADVPSPLGFLNTHLALFVAICLLLAGQSFRPLGPLCLLHRPENLCSWILGILLP